MDDRTMEGTAPCVSWRKAEAEEENFAEESESLQLKRLFGEIRHRLPPSPDAKGHIT